MFAVTQNLQYENRPPRRKEGEERANEASSSQRGKRKGEGKREKETSPILIAQVSQKLFAMPS